ncbi:Serine/threonine-protein kinase AFC2 [Camellia lanceoleosa]|uniref:Serine/threonine-protein kinase AFC2 n=1 Tax=Camellia lanceoleosa TaxID=1840588 RepID=A0ACC0G1Y1_9ERIC|nr:Serine/threonine-protein kinase AFC2 [Camellia lanceoleosa]
MEMERVIEFPHADMDLLPRKRPRLGWDVAPQALKAENAIVSQEQVVKLLAYVSNKDLYAEFYSFSYTSLLCYQFEVLSSLHPTPAVYGFPTEEACILIAETVCAKNYRVDRGNLSVGQSLHQNSRINQPGNVEEDGTLEF